MTAPPQTSQSVLMPLGKPERWQATAGPSFPCEAARRLFPLMASKAVAIRQGRMRQDTSGGMGWPALSAGRPENLSTDGQQSACQRFAREETFLEAMMKRKTHGIQTPSKLYFL